MYLITIVSFVLAFKLKFPLKSVWVPIFEFFKKTEAPIIGLLFSSITTPEYIS